MGERFHIYAAGTWPPAAGGDGRRKIEQATQVWSRDLAMPDAEAKAAWMMEMMAELMQRKLPTGVIVGSAVIDRITAPESEGGLYRWHLTDVERATVLRKPTGHPQPVWFREGGGRREEGVRS